MSQAKPYFNSALRRWRANGKYLTLKVQNSQTEHFCKPEYISQSFYLYLFSSVFLRANDTSLLIFALSALQLSSDTCTHWPFCSCTVNPIVTCSHSPCTTGCSTCTPHSSPNSVSLLPSNHLTITFHQADLSSAVGYFLPLIRLPFTYFQWSLQRRRRKKKKTENSLAHWHVLTHSCLPLPPCFSILVTFATTNFPDLLATLLPRALALVPTFQTLLYPL